MQFHIHIKISQSKARLKTRIPSSRPKHRYSQGSFGTDTALNICLHKMLLRKGVGVCVCACALLETLWAYAIHLQELPVHETVCICGSSKTHWDSPQLSARSYSIFANNLEKLWESYGTKVRYFHQPEPAFHLATRLCKQRSRWVEFAMISKEALEVQTRNP